MSKYLHQRDNVMRLLIVVTVESLAASVCPARHALFLCNAKRKSLIALSVRNGYVSYAMNADPFLF